MGSGFPGATVRRCNSEFVALAMSAAVLAASCASLEPSVASRIVVGKMLIASSPCLGQTYALVTPCSAARCALMETLDVGMHNATDDRELDGRGSGPGVHV